LLLTIASIVCFQPWVTEGIVEPPANPLVIHQPCLRFDDYRNVGYTARHSVAFTMSAHHAFNKYWKEEMLQLCIEFFQDLGFLPEEITFKLSMWEGGGNAGECYEVIISGLEVATLVLMHYKEDPQGTVELQGRRYSELPVKVIDTGYGAERILWILTGKPTVFDAVYPELVKHLEQLFGVDKDEKEQYINQLLSGRVDRQAAKKLASMYRLLDFLRVICLLAHDGAVPSNKKDGYLLRLAIRQAYSLLWKYTEKEDLKEEAKQMFYWIKENIDPAFDQRRLEYILEVLEIEKERFKKLVEQFRNFDFSRLKTPEDVAKLYETQGLPIFYYEDRLPCEVDQVFELLAGSKLTGGVKKIKQEKKLLPLPKELPPTQQEYYTDPYCTETRARILWVSENEKYVVLDRTIFYPEGGGQPADTGFINNRRVRRAFLQEGKIVHELED